MKHYSVTKQKNLVSSSYDVTGDTDFVLEKPILLPGSFNATSGLGKLAAKTKTLAEKAASAVFMSYPQMNEKCILCKKCIVTCPKKALSVENKKIVLDKKKCIGCLCCDEVCTNGAVDIKKKLSLR